MASMVVNYFKMRTDIQVIIKAYIERMISPAFYLHLPAL